MLKYLLNIGKKRMIVMIIGNILIGIGISIFKLSGMGNDPFSGMIMSVSAILHLSYATFLIMLNSLIFILELSLGRKYIGIGTVVNWFLVGYVAELFIWLSNKNIVQPESFMGRLPLVIVGVIIVSLGVSLYQTSNVGIAPFDSLSLIMRDRLPFSYFWCRMFCDGLCAAICLLTGGLLGLGTFLCAFCLGPIIHFFNEKLSKKLLAPRI